MKNSRIKGFVQPVLNLFRFRSRTAIVATATAATGTTSSSASFLFYSRNYVVAASVVEDREQTAESLKESLGNSYGLNLALARKGVIVKDKAFYNLKSAELQQKGAIAAENLSDLPVYVRKDVAGGASEISKSQLKKLLEKVTTHLSSISNVFVHDGAVGSSSYCDAKIRIISDSPSAVLSLYKFLWKTSLRAVSHDSCPLTVYVANDISSKTGEVIGLGSKSSSIGFIAADIERSSLILCGKAFLDTYSVKKVVAALAGPIISARDGLPLSARLIASRDSVMLLFAPENIVKSFSELASDVGVVLSCNGVAPMFQTGDCTRLFKLPSVVILASSDSSRSIPSISKLSPGQAAYHFLAGYHNGKFVPAYNDGPSAFDPLELAMALLRKLKDNDIESFLVNVYDGQKPATGEELVKLVQSTLSKSKSIPVFEAKGGDLQRMYKYFLSSKYQELPKEFSF